MEPSPPPINRVLGDSITRWQIATTIAFGVLLLLFLASALVVARSVARLRISHEAYAASSEGLNRVSNILQVLTDAETGQRGYLLTQDQEYLQPYRASTAQLDQLLANPGHFIESTPEAAQAFLTLKRAAQEKEQELKETLDRAHTVSFPAAIQLVQTGKGREAMQQVVSSSELIKRTAKAELERVGKERLEIAGDVRNNLVFSTVSLTVLLLLSYLLSVRSLDASRRERTLRELRAAELEKAVEERTADLTEAVRELQGFTYSVSHDMRAPLRWIVGSSQMLLEDYVEDIPQDAVELLRRQIIAGNKLSKLIDDLLTYARLARKPMAREPVNLVEVAKRLLHEESDVQLESPPELMVFGDPEMLEIVLQNLLENSLKYRSPQRPLVITLDHVQTDGGDAIFVRDNGIGFDTKYMHKIFQPFERLHRDTEYPGTGIGLANVKRIIERHGGKVWAGGEPGAGATFFFTLP